jgi:hypothetical protein
MGFLNFLGDLGSGLAQAFAGGAGALGKGVVTLGRGVGSGVKRLGQLGDEEDDLGPGGTPPFVPSNNGPRGVPVVDLTNRIGTSIADAEDHARDIVAPQLAPQGPSPSPAYIQNLAGDRGAPALPDLPISRADISIPARPLPVPSPAPSFNSIVPAPTTLPDLSPARAVTLAPAAAPAMPSLSAPTSGMDLDRRNIPIPQLPGRAGAPVSYNPIEAAKYDAVMSHAKRDAEGNLLGKDQGGGFNRSWKTTVQNALRGASMAAAANPRDPLGAALGGAVTAGAGSLINPQAGYEFNFDTGQRPRMEAEAERQRRERAQAMEDVFNQAKIDQIPIQAEHGRLQNEQIRSQIDIGKQNAERQKMLADAQVNYYNAKAEASRTGNPKVTDRVNLITGEIEKVQVFPDGHEQVVGGSAAAAINRQNIESREKIAGQHEAAATNRAGMAQGGANARSQASIAGAKERTQMRIDAADRRQANAAGRSKLQHPSSSTPSSTGGPGKTITDAQVRAAAAKKGISEAEGRKRAAALGYTITKD